MIRSGNGSILKFITYENFGFLHLLHVRAQKGHWLWLWFTNPTWSLGIHFLGKVDILWVYQAYETLDPFVNSQQECTYIRNYRKLSRTEFEDSHPILLYSSSSLWIVHPPSSSVTKSSTSSANAKQKVDGCKRAFVDTNTSNNGLALTHTWRPYLFYTSCHYGVYSKSKPNHIPIII